MANMIFVSNLKAILNSKIAKNGEGSRLYWPRMGSNTHSVAASAHKQGVDAAPTLQRRLYTHDYEQRSAARNLNRE